MFRVFVSYFCFYLCPNLIPKPLPVPLVLPSLGVCAFPLPTYFCQVSSLSTRLRKSHLCTSNRSFDVSDCPQLWHSAPVNHSADVPSVVVTVDDRLWKEFFDLRLKVSAMPSVLSTSSGSQALADHVVTIR